jgi:hypothetical protein
MNSSYSNPWSRLLRSISDQPCLQISFRNPLRQPLSHKREKENLTKVQLLIPVKFGWNAPVIVLDLSDRQTTEKRSLYIDVILYMRHKKTPPSKQLDGCCQTLKNQEWFPCWPKLFKILDNEHHPLNPYQVCQKYFPYIDIETTFLFKIQW